MIDNNNGSERGKSRKLAVQKELIACAAVGCVLALLFFGKALFPLDLQVVAEFLPGGVRVSYFKDAEFRQLVCTRTARSIIRDYGRGSPVWGIVGNVFSARWQGFIIVPEDGEYSFYLQSNNGARLLIDGEIVIEHWTPHRWIPGKHGQKRLTKGRHSICVDHYRTTGSAAIRLRWCGGPIPPNTVLAVPYLRKE